MSNIEELEMSKQGIINMCYLIHNDASKINKRAIEGVILLIINKTVRELNDRELKIFRDLTIEIYNEIINSYY